MSVTQTHEPRRAGAWSGFWLSAVGPLPDMYIGQFSERSKHRQFCILLQVVKHFALGYMCWIVGGLGGKVRDRRWIPLEFSDMEFTGEICRRALPVADPLSRGPVDQRGLDCWPGGSMLVAPSCYCQSSDGNPPIRACERRERLFTVTKTVRLFGPVCQEFFASAPPVNGP